MPPKSGFFSTAPKKLKDEKTQYSRKKLKTQAKNSMIRKIFGVIYCNNQQKRPKNKGKTTKMAKSRIKHSNYY